MKSASCVGFPSSISSLTIKALALAIVLPVCGRAAAVQPTPAALAVFNTYCNGVEQRLARQHGAARGFLAPAGFAGQNDARMRNGGVIIERLTPEADEVFAGAMLHHWRGTAFVAGADVADFENLMQDFAAYPVHFRPQVQRARLLSRKGDALEAAMRVSQRHVLNVVMDTSYDIRFGRLDARHAYSIAHSTKISEIDAAGTPDEHALDMQHEHGFLWRQNTYWSVEQRDGGLYMQIESISLTRAIPRGLGWAVGSYVESIPRDSLEFTLTAVQRALHK